MFVYNILWPLHFGFLLVLNLNKEDYLQIFKCVSFNHTAVVVNGKVGRPYTGLTTPTASAVSYHYSWPSSVAVTTAV